MWAPEALYGANRSQDSAQGYVAGDDQATFGTNCSRDLMVRAYDHQAAAWSNLLDVADGC